jgi:hypothetical protein
MTPQEKWDAEAGAYDGIGARPSESEQPAHTDHSLRHFDRTCEACISEGRSEKQQLTPRTDANVILGGDIKARGNDSDEFVRAPLARQLERELAEADGAS